VAATTVVRFFLFLFLRPAASYFRFPFDIASKNPMKVADNKLPQPFTTKNQTKRKSDHVRTIKSMMCRRNGAAATAPTTIALIHLDIDGLVCGLPTHRPVGTLDEPNFKPRFTHTHTQRQISMNR